jgi:regulator of RNase E activity RraB
LSDAWDFYFARINDAPASIFIDLGIRAEVPLEKRPWLLWVWIQLKAPKPDGLATNEEAASLNPIGEALEAVISATCGAQLVARVTGAGRREFYFYATEPGELQSACATAMKAFEDYKSEFGSTFQPDWDQYLMLFPSDNNLERMHNRRVLQELAQQGDVHEAPRKVEHWLHFADESTRTACRDTLTAIGFAVEDESVSEEESEDLRYQLVVSRIDSVDSHTINAITIELARLAREHEGAYQGWDCAVTRGEALQ